MISPFDSFKTTCKTYPDSIAVVFQKRLFTYREVYDKCMSISQLLDQAGVKANTIVAVSMQRSMEMIASVLAILHRKAVFLLLDINQPKSRLQAIISQSKPECILSCNLAGSIQAEQTGEQTPHAFQTAIAYLGFTSGSTGKPKGVAITEASLANCIHHFPDILGLQPGDRITSFLNCSFDMFIFETVVSLCRGLTIIMPIIIEPISKAITENWLGPYRYVYRLRIKALQYYYSKYQENALFIAANMIVLQDLSVLFEWMDEGRRIMYQQGLLLHARKPPSFCGISSLHEPYYEALLLGIGT